MKRRTPPRVLPILALALPQLAAAGEARILDEICLPAGIMERSVCLADGHWEGEPFVAGAASRPGIRLLDVPELAADFDGDGREEIAGLISVNSGGSGEQVYLVVAHSGPGTTEAVSTRLLGDRVRVRSLAAEGKGLRLDVVRHAEGDPMCCPTEQAVLRFVFRDGALVDVDG